MNVFENFIKTVNYWIIELKSIFYLLKVAQLIMLLEPQATLHDSALQIKYFFENCPLCNWRMQSLGRSGLWSSQSLN